MLVQAAPGFAGGEVYHDEAWAAFVGGVHKVCDVDVGSEVEAEVVEVGVGVVDGGWKGVGRVYCVVVERDSD